VALDQPAAAALDRILTGLRAQLEPELRAYANELAALSDLERVRAVSQAATAAADAARRQAQAQLAQVRDAARAQATVLLAHRLADAVRTIDEAPTLSDILAALLHGAAREVERVVILLVKGDALQPWRWSGFGDQAVASALLPLQDAEMAGEVVRTRVMVSRPAGGAPVTWLPGAEGDASRAMAALPVLVGGAVVAVVYADAPAPDQPASTSGWPAVLDVLSRHASRTLEAVTVQRAVGISPDPVARASHHTTANHAGHAEGS